MAQFHCSLYDLDQTDIETLFGFAGYAMRKSAAPSGEILTKPAPSQQSTLSIGGKMYKRVSADNASWLR